jgi:hypothetical protein
MAVDEGRTNARRSYFVWVCPNCGKTVHISRSYCDCHADIAQAKARITEKAPEVDKCNFETAGLTCNDCPEPCNWCFSFGVNKTNNTGFGGADCRYRKNDARCYCCQAQVKLAAKLSTDDFWKLMNGSGGMNSTKFYAMADFIRTEMEKPVLARIQHAREEAGLMPGTIENVSDN